MNARLLRTLSIVVALVMLVAGCESPRPSPSGGVSPTPAPSPTSPASTAAPTSTTGPAPTGTAGGPFPLAVVTGLTNLKATIAIDDLATLAGSGKLVLPCGVTVNRPALKPTAPCIAANQIAAAIGANQNLIALLPSGLVEPATKVMPIAGDGPFGLFGPDLFGDPKARAVPYPVLGTASAGATLDPAWTAYDASSVWTMTAIGSLCADRGAARQAVTLAKGWDWVFDGGTAK